FPQQLGQEITLDCGHVESTLPFSYNWKLHADLIDDEYSSTLTINNATSISAGVYTCIVTSIVGQTSAEGVTVNVYAPPKFREEPDDINHLMMQEYQFGENNASFICEASGIPRPNISWFYKDFEQMEEIDLYQFNSELILDNINVSHAGLYYCKANNSHGVITSRSAKLNVLKVEFPEQFIEVGIDILKIEQNTSSQYVSDVPENQKTSSNFNESISNGTSSSNQTIHNATMLTNHTNMINYDYLFEDLTEQLRSSTNQEITYLSNQTMKDIVTTLHFTVKSIIGGNNNISNNFNSAQDVFKVSG
ncbi:MAG: immunoglobulin domain-containing protein, partial [Cyanobacteria bacterium J06649_11]